ncbi:hypothetical protein BEN74_12530 [Acinetobacter sp. WCHAc010034]|uniref:hypothetical protein n=1 Tax=Acinetobacter sp. WCHAc010034 TaxID=1879049 RepID=UPI00083ABC13|nr:hypothetical protein [Acinetobacter sp. WCHAc010034]AYA03560.1 hypothetical protein BEN74_12530 [Acinetobacter sp. WCHAc010034]
MNIFSHTLKTALCAGLALASASLWAQQPAAQQSEKPVKPYGSNPNIFHVWAYKTQEGVLGTAKKVGGAAERGAAKVKPSVDQAWDSTKDIASNTAHKVDEGAQKAAQSATAKIQETKDAIGGKPQQPAPIEQRPLSESSSAGSPAVPKAAPAGGSAPTAYPVTDL